MTAEGQDKMQDGAGQDRLVTAEEIQNPDPALRPQRLADFVGQGQGRANPGNLYRGRLSAGRADGPCASAWPARAGQNNHGPNHLI